MRGRRLERLGQQHRTPEKRSPKDRERSTRRKAAESATHSHNLEEGRRRKKREKRLWTREDVWKLGRSVKVPDGSTLPKRPTTQSLHSHPPEHQYTQGAKHQSECSKDSREDVLLGPREIPRNRKEKRL